MNMRRRATRKPGSLSALRHDETGKGMLRTLFALALVASVVYVGVKFIPPRTAALQFSDAVRDEIISASSRRRSTDETIRKNLVERAQALRLPIQSGDIKITRPGTKYIIIDVEYIISIDLIGGYSFKWPFSPHHEGPLIF